MAELVVRLADPGDLPKFDHQFGNFGEDVFRWLRANGWGEVDIAEMDRGGGRFVVARIVAKNLRRVIKWIEEEALRHHLQVVVERA